MKRKYVFPATRELPEATVKLPSREAALKMLAMRAKLAPTETVGVKNAAGQTLGIIHPTQEALPTVIEGVTQPDEQHDDAELEAFFARHLADVLAEAKGRKHVEMSDLEEPKQAVRDRIMPNLTTETGDLEESPKKAPGKYAVNDQPVPKGTSRSGAIEIANSLAAATGMDVLVTVVATGRVVKKIAGVTISYKPGREPKPEPVGPEPVVASVTEEPHPEAKRAPKPEPVQAIAFDENLYGDGKGKFGLNGRALHALVTRKQALGYAEQLASATGQEVQVSNVRTGGHVATVGAQATAPEPVAEAEPVVVAVVEPEPAMTVRERDPKVAKLVEEILVSVTTGLLHSERLYRAAEKAVEEAGIDPDLWVNAEKVAREFSWVVNEEIEEVLTNATEQSLSGYLEAFADDIAAAMA